MEKRNNRPAELLTRPDLLQTLARAEQVIRWVPDGRDGTAHEPSRQTQVLEGPLQVGVDLGTAYLVLVVLDQHQQPMAGEYQFAQVARDGLVVDFVGAVDRLTAMKRRVEGRLGLRTDACFQWLSTRRAPGGGARYCKRGRGGWLSLHRSGGRTHARQMP